MIDTIRINFNLDDFIEKNSNFSFNHQFKFFEGLKNLCNIKSCYDIINKDKFESTFENENLKNFHCQIKDTIRVFVTDKYISLECSLTKLLYNNNLENLKTDNEIKEACHLLENLTNDLFLHDFSINFFHFTRIDISYNYINSNSLNIKDIESNFLHSTKKKVFKVQNRENQETLNFMSSNLRNRFLIYDKKKEIESIIKKLDKKEIEKIEYLKSIIKEYENKNIIRFEKRLKIENHLKFNHLLDDYSIINCKSELIKEIEKLKLIEINKLDFYNYFLNQKKINFSEKEIFLFFLYKENNFKFQDFFRLYLNNYNKDKIYNIFTSIDRIMKKLNKNRSEKIEMQKIIKEIEKF